jgi:transposase
MSPTDQFCDEFTISHDHHSFAKAIKRIKVIAQQFNAPVVVAMEGYNGYAAPFDRHLVSTGFTVMAVNNLRFSRYREMFGQPYKNDPYDARLLANFIHRQPTIDKRSGAQTIFSPDRQTAVIKKLARYQLDLIREATRYKLKLNKLMAGYLPELKQVYRNLFSANCLALVSQGITPDQLSKLPIKFLASIKAPQGTRALGKVRATKIKALAAGVHQTLIAAIDARILASYARRIQELTEEICLIDKELNNLLMKLQPGRLILSFHGIGVRLAARILGETIDIRRFSTRDKYSAYCGVVCLDNSSGKCRRSKPAKQVNHILKDAFMRFALSSISLTPESTSYYQRKRTEGMGHWSATKRLAHQLCKMIYKSLHAETLAIKQAANF